MEEEKEVAVEEEKEVAVEEEEEEKERKEVAVEEEEEEKEEEEEEERKEVDNKQFFGIVGGINGCSREVEEQEVEGIGLRIESIGNELVLYFSFVVPTERVGFHTHML